MIAKSLRLHQFKNIPSANCEFSPRLNCFFGNNGMGKTNLLDALYYLSFTKSHLNINDSLAIQSGTDMTIVGGAYLSDIGNDEEIALSLKSDGARMSKTLKRNGKSYQAFKEHIGQFPLIIITPQDSQLIIGSPEERRRFLDQFLSQRSMDYMDALMQYKGFLAHRNAALKNGTSDPLTLEYIEAGMAASASLISRTRREFIETFAPLFDKYYEAISGGMDNVSLGYDPSISFDSESDFLDALNAVREKDRILGYTTVGVHRDDISMKLGEELIRKVGSQGQCKSFLIALKLAQFVHLKEKTEERPMLLLDDIFDKLDAERMERIINLVSEENFGQIFVTDTNRKHLDEIIDRKYDDYRLFAVNNGEVMLEKY